MESGINSRQYIAIRNHYAALASSLDSNAGAKTGLERHLIAKGWVGTTPGGITADALISLVMDKIRNDASVFRDTISLLKDIPGLGDIAIKIEGACFFLSSCENSLIMRGRSPFCITCPCTCISNCFLHIHR